MCTNIFGVEEGLTENLCQENRYGISVGGGLGLSSCSGTYGNMKHDSADRDLDYEVVFVLILNEELVKIVILDLHTF